MNSKDKVQNKLVASIRKTKETTNKSTVNKETTNKSTVNNDTKATPKNLKAVVKQTTNNKKQQTPPSSKKTQDVKSSYIEATKRVWPD